MTCLNIEYAFMFLIAPLTTIPVEPPNKNTGTRCS
jgi:hypothetical protein